MRATFLAGGPGIAKGEVTARTIDLAPTLSYILGIPEPQQSQGRVLTELLKGGNSIKPISIVGLNDFHGQLDPTTVIGDNNINVPVGGASFLATMFDEELASLPGPGLILAGGDNVGASPANSGLLDDMPTIDVENAWGLDATSYGNHEFDYGVDRPEDPAATGALPVPGHEHRRHGDGQAAAVGDPVGRVQGQRRQGRRHRRRAAVHAGARRRRRDGRAHVPRRGPAHQGRIGAPQGAGRERPGRRHPPGHGGRAQPDRQRRRHSVDRPDPAASPTSSRTRRSTR